MPLNAVYDVFLMNTNSNDALRHYFRCTDAVLCPSLIDSQDLRHR